jgi:hypothetical protein
MTVISAVRSADWHPRGVAGATEHARDGACARNHYDTDGPTAGERSTLRPSVSVVTGDRRVEQLLVKAPAKLNIIQRDAGFAALGVDHRPLPQCQRLIGEDQC